MAPSIDSEPTPTLQYPTPLDPTRGTPLNTNHATPIDLTVPILIVGGGPVGMLQALILSRLHSIPSLLIERETSTTRFPKMEYTNGRSMSIYRLLGLAEEFRNLSPVPDDCDNNEIIATSLMPGGKLIHVWERDGVEEQRAKGRRVNDGAQYLEPHLRCHQIVVEKWLKEKIEGEELVDGRWGVKFVGLEEREDGVVSELVAEDGRVLRVKSDYVIGTDGGGSYVRKSAGLESKRTYLDLTVAFVHLRSSQIRAKMPLPRAWHSNVIGGGILVSQNEDDIWTCHFLVPPGMDGSALSTEDILALTIGGCQGPLPFPVDEVYCKGVWRADVAIANSFRSEGGRIFLAGDSAHQLSPVGGHGLNSGIGDAFDLGWKLAATIQGWAGPNLLASYDVERRQIAFENLKHVTDALATVIQPIFGSVAVHGPALINGDSPESEKVREEIKQHCIKGHWMHDQNGNILGYSYKESPVIVEKQEASARPQGTDHVYVPTTFPGSQAPHVFLENGKSTLDALSPTSYSLIDFSDAKLGAVFVDAAAGLRLPLQIISWDSEDNSVGKIYERSLVLVRPDGHVAWRSADGQNKAITREEATSILRTVSGHV